MKKRPDYDLLPEEERLIRKGKKTVRLRLALAGIVLLIFISLIVFVFAEPPGEVYVSSNIPGARVYMDSFSTEYTTNCTVREVPLGEHLFTVELDGYHTVGKYAQWVKVSPGSCDSLHFVMTKSEVDYGPSGD